MLLFEGRLEAALKQEEFGPGGGDGADLEGGRQEVEEGQASHPGAGGEQALGGQLTEEAAGGEREGGWRHTGGSVGGRGGG